MKSLVTGIGGFAGSHLAELLVREGHEVVGVAFPGEDLSNLRAIRDRADIREADICDGGGLGAALSGVEAEWVFHLAAVASVPAAFGDPAAALRVNVVGTGNVLEAARAHRPAKFVYVSSADVYGQVGPDELPVRETRACKPGNPYAASKAAAEVICGQYWRTFAVPVVVVRPFNHTGPRQGAGFAPSDFARAISRIEKGLDEPRLAVGNLDAMRDYSDVRDIVEGYRLAAMRGEAGETYNISSGRSIRIGDLLEKLLAMSETEIEVVTEAAKARPSDTPVVVGDHGKFSRRTGWQAERSFDETLGDLLVWWRQREW